MPIVIAPESASEIVDFIKSEANRVIERKLPEFKQRNLTARSTELIRRRVDGFVWSADEQAEADAIQAEWDWVKSVRTFSDSLEADALAGNITSKGQVKKALWP